MKIYLVGGAVRDQLLGLPIKERDWVVVGATIADMLQQGFRQVGKDFPVFLHPKTGEEYALARTERKIGRGYTGFEFDTSTTVTLEEDLKRRDLTINAIAQTSDGEIIDPYHGQIDLAKKVLRHVSHAFAEDPVRILRIARFAARFGFEIAPETRSLMQSMVKAGEVDALVAERVWKEFERALTEKYPEKFFATLNDCGALVVLFPSIEPQGNGIKALLKAAKDALDPSIRFAALMHPLSPPQIKMLCDRYRIPNDYRDVANLVIKYLPQYEIATQLSAEKLLDLLLAVDAFRREMRFNHFLQACEACASKNSTPLLKQCYLAAKNVNTTGLENLSGKEIAEKIKQARLQAIQQWKSQS